MSVQPQFSNETEDVILQRMLDEVVPDVDKRQGAVTYDLLAPAAVELANTYINMDLVLKYAFINEDMPSDILTLAAADFGVDRKEGGHAVGYVKFRGPVNRFISTGTVVRTDSGLSFATTRPSAITSMGITTIEVRALEPGENGNIGINEITTIVGNLAGIVRVNNEFNFEGGTNPETDEELLQRVYDKLRKPATSGNAYHYEMWAKEVNGVGEAKVYPVWDGPGTVKVVILGANKQPPSNTVVQNVESHIATEQPIGAICTVVGAQSLPIDIEVDLTLVSNQDPSEVQIYIEEHVTEYLDRIAFIDNLVRVSRIAAIILDGPGVLDYANLTVNGGSGNVAIADEDVATLGDVTINVV